MSEWFVQFWDSLSGEQASFVSALPAIVLLCTIIVTAAVVILRERRPR